MFDTIILLTGPGEQAALSALLLGHNPGLSIRAIGTREALDALAPELLARARLIGFATPVVVPARILGALGYGAYNFHPDRRNIRVGCRRISRFMTECHVSGRPRTS